MAGLVLEPEDVRRAVRRGAVSAGLMIEQVGFPSLTTEGKDGAEERWNGESAEERLREMEAREEETS